MSHAPSDPPAAPIDVVLVEDHDMVAEAIQLAFEPIPDIRIVARARTGAEALTQVRAHQPRVVVLDRRLPDGDGIERIGAIRESSPHSAVLVLTGEASPSVAARAVAAGGGGLVVKSAGLDDLVTAVRRVATGEAVFGTQLLGEVFDRLTGRSATTPLTPREHEALVLLASGATTEQIAEKLRLAKNTVRNHIQRVLVKLGAHSKLEAVAVARREGLID
ncbi:two component transcriptional regulator, LuxR family [Amycolatopsis marina]|uniref:Two component transcriptional regulator, LuxR family n=1 Tax=Amycolatopsis marina TaxID=490629 RepID=A0A1I1A434_9PSEU|nr:response regulator transcription factor [Amycolatopsis marina]SFB32705.1 two component transcriptional regulator, LuxR family [Amycolatopsis marina]